MVESQRVATEEQLSSLRPEDFRLFTDWLLRVGWTPVSEGSRGRLFQFGSSTVAIPNQVWRDPAQAHGAVERVAMAMDRSLTDVLKRLAEPLNDRIEFALRGQRLRKGRVPLGAASEALRNSRRLLSASGTSALAPAWSVGRRYSPKAQSLAKNAELAHTEDGSFVFPLYVALDQSDAPPLSFAEGSLAPEPYERRVTRTLATAVATATTLADQPIRELQDSDLDVASSIGVSRELCVSLDELMLNSEVDEVQINFDWSPAFGPTDSLPPSVLILRGSRPGLRDLATRLARPEPIVSEVYSGPILEIGHSSEEDEEEGFFFVLDTTYQERPSRLRVLLTQAQHDQAIPWYRDRATVIVRGNAVQMKTMILMSAPDRIDAWSRGQFDLT